VTVSTSMPMARWMSASPHSKQPSPRSRSMRAPRARVVVRARVARRAVKLKHRQTAPSRREKSEHRTHSGHWACWRRWRRWARAGASLAEKKTREVSVSPRAFALSRRAAAFRLLVRLWRHPQVGTQLLMPLWEALLDLSGVRDARYDYAIVAVFPIGGRRHLEFVREL